MSKVKDILKVGDLVIFTFGSFLNSESVSEVTEIGFRSWDRWDKVNHQTPVMSHWKFREIDIQKIFRNEKQIWPKPLHELWMVLSNGNSNYGEYSERDSAEERLAFCKRRFSDTEFRIVHMREVRDE